MDRRKICEGVDLMGAVHWDRRLFDSLIPLPDGTSYNSYLVRGTDKTALIDTVDPDLIHVLKQQLADVPKIDFIVSNHTEQDHSGSIPWVLSKYPDAKVLCSTMAKTLLADHLHLPAGSLQAVKDGETIDLGGKSLRFISTPWVHWPETMVTWLAEDRILFSCDFFGSHLATTDMFLQDEGIGHEAAKRYFAEIMMPFRETIVKNMEKLSGLAIRYIAPSHGPLYDRPSFILDAYKDWTMSPPKNICVIPYVSMHGSTKIMVEHLSDSLARHGIKVELFDLAVTDIGKLAMALVDASTIVVGTPTVRGGAHPLAHTAANLANMIFPKLRYAAIIGSYGWKSNMIEHISGLIPNLKVEVLGTLVCKGRPRPEDFSALDSLAETIAQKHKQDA
jgi:flavorubredoxin